ncbi:hypothetical protein [Humisphaera borealis]|uniref:Uncharacterized protein n=1 Tax=Humisphaera borealis TaxID=2807512 RepID=A0A7M2WZJ1_9BACT|nr:hypothetical protein [Humisphaera borealis]QOV90612.1 hypothetical protein IPV69_04405 [Humisphaera borealis]
MPTEDEQQHSVNDISHLFLSNVRSLAGQGMPRPVRKPPGSHSLPATPGAPTSAPVAESAHRSIPTYGTSQPAAMSDEGGIPSVDLTPEEYAQVFATGQRRDASAEAGASPARVANTDDAQLLSATGLADSDIDAVAPVTALLASHLGARQLERARDYARHLAASGHRVGLIDLDVSEFRLYLIDPAIEPGAEVESRQNVTTGMCEAHEIAEAIAELNVDVDHWLLLLPNLRTPEAKAILRDCESWTVLTTCDHDGVVSAYRTLKGVVDARVDETGKSTRLGLTTLDAAGDAEANRVLQKLAGVCRQFLGWEINPETPVRYAAGVAEHPLMNCRVTRDKAHLAAAPHWAVVSEMLSRPRRGQADTHVPDTRTVAHDSGEKSQPAVTAAPAMDSALTAEPVGTPQSAVPRSIEPSIRRVDVAESPVVMTSGVSESRPTPAPAPSMQKPAETTDFTMPRLSIAGDSAPARTSSSDDVIDLPGDADDINGILSAVLRRAEFGVVECPIGVPSCPNGRLAVTRDRGLAIVAAASRGLSELRAIGKAFQWMLENRSLIAMAMPQFAIDTNKTPAIILLVDQADITGDLLRPMMQADHVMVRAYRTLKWAGRTGLLLEAA